MAASEIQQTTGTAAGTWSTLTGASYSGGTALASGAAGSTLTPPAPLGTPTPLGVPPTPASSSDPDDGPTPQERAASDDAPRPYAPAPDLAENDGVVAKQPEPGAPKRPKQRNRRHGRPR